MADKIVEYIVSFMDGEEPDKEHGRKIVRCAFCAYCFREDEYEHWCTGWGARRD